MNETWQMMNDKEDEEWWGMMLNDERGIVVSCYQLWSWSMRDDEDEEDECYMMINEQRGWMTHDDKWRCRTRTTMYVNYVCFEGMNEWKLEQMNEWTNEWLTEWMNEWISEWMNK